MSEMSTLKEATRVLVVEEDAVLQTLVVELFSDMGIAVIAASQ